MKKSNQWLLLTVGIFLGLLAVTFFCSCGSTPRLITLQVETKPAADIYFDTFYVGTGSVDLQVFSNTVPNYLEMRDIITNEILTRLLIFEIPNLQRIILEYGDEDWREERIQHLLEYMTKSGILEATSSDSLNGQNLLQEDPPEDLELDR